MRAPVDVRVTVEGDDKGKVFRLTPMDAWTAEKWGWRATSVLARSGVELPPVDMLGNMVIVAAFGLQALMSASFAEAEPLLDEMLKCVQAVPDPANYPDLARPLVASDTAEISTLLWLRGQVLSSIRVFPWPPCYRI